MKAARIMVLLAVLAVASSAYCQFATNIYSARQLGMGGASIAVADDAWAYAQNPAGLPNVQTNAGEGKWGGTVDGQLAFSSTDFFNNDLDFAAAAASFVAPDKSWGFGVGYGHQTNSDGATSIYGFGVGAKFRNDYHQMSWGVSVVRMEFPVFTAEAYGVAPAIKGYTMRETDDIVNAGLLGNVQVGDYRPIRVGLTVFDVANEVGRSWNGGIAFHAGPSVLIAADLVGGGSLDRTWVAGAEWNVCHDFFLRVGDANGKVAYGAGWQHGNVYIDAARYQQDEFTLNMVGAGLKF